MAGLGGCKVNLTPRPSPQTEKGIDARNSRHVAYDAFAKCRVFAARLPLSVSTERGLGGEVWQALALPASLKNALFTRIPYEMA
jgi:hypothetical protein